MKRLLMVFCIAAAVVSTGYTAAIAGAATCSSDDHVCRELAALAEKEQFDRIIEEVERNKEYSVYSGPAKKIIGEAYLMKALRQTTRQKQELYCRKALPFDLQSAYLGFLYINSGAVDERTLDFLKQYVVESPRDTEAYRILGEAYLDNGAYRSAKAYLLKAKELDPDGSPATDWLLFQTSYLLGDLTTAGNMLDNVFKTAQPVNELRALASDKRFIGLETWSPYRRYVPLITAAQKDTAR